MAEARVSFGRLDGHRLESGVFVIYGLLPPYNLQIVATRDGILVQGVLPLCGVEGIDAFKKMLTRAQKQHERLASFQIGEKQIPYSELELLDMESVIVM